MSVVLNLHPLGMPRYLPVHNQANLAGVSLARWQLQDLPCSHKPFGSRAPLGKELPALDGPLVFIRVYG